MAKIEVLAGDFPKGKADFNHVFIDFRKAGKVYYIDVESYNEESGGLLELSLFNGKRILVANNPAFLRTLKTALFDEPQDIEVRRQRWQERQAKGGTKVKEPLTLGKVILWILLGMVGLSFLGHCYKANEDPSTEPNTAARSPQQQSTASSKIAQGILDFRYTRQAYPKLYQRWGAAGVARINELIPKAALLVANEPSCDKVEMVEVSDARSKPRNHIVFFADCTNGKRFFVSETDIKSQSTVTAEQDKPIDRMQAIRQCDNAIKQQLAHPGTFDSHITDTGVGVNPNGNILVTRGFSAKNGMGMKIDYRAHCVISNGNIDVSIEQK